MKLNNKVGLGFDNVQKMNEAVLAKDCVHTRRMRAIAYF